MNKTKVLAVLVILVSMPAVLFADFRDQMDRLEFGVPTGIGFYVGQRSPVDGSSLLRIQAYDAVGFDGAGSVTSWPGIETFGFVVGYRYDAHWHFNLQTVRQRVAYEEWYPNEKHSVYYNAMWHLDAMAEFNILPLGNEASSGQGFYNIVPYVGAGLGLTMYNKDATLRNNKKVGTGDINTMYPMVGGKDHEVGVGMYLPLAVGAKWRVHDNVQLKATFQYQLYLTPSTNLGGGTYDAEYATDRPTYDELTKKFGSDHNCLFSVSAIFNLGKWYEDRVITY